MGRADMDDIDRGGLIELFVDTLPDHATFLVDVEGRILSWNAAAGDLLGYDAQEVIGRNFACLCTGPGNRRASFAGALTRDGTIDANVRVLAKPYRKHELAERVKDALSA